MLKKTQGIVLSSIKYKETSIIVKIFTRELGLKSYLVNGVRSQGNRSKIALYQPLTLLDMVVYDKDNGGLQRVSEARLLQANQLIPFDVTRTGIALFMTEVTSKSIYENYQNENLFDFLQNCVIHLDSKEVSMAQFPLIFLIENARYLGFAPEKALGFLAESRSQPFSKSELLQAEVYLEALMKDSFSNQLKIGKGLRQKLLDHLLDFYSQHLDNPGNWKSLAILRQISN
ncbi:DNA repair protein RecO [Algoriphagus halophytocola]|uniref:DNA repair protein RecO n=1 Tax=Algoriphagus halophytocola TaxID=2991499 RepID=A0ABY6MDL9_9BACT|nr:MULTISPECIES: DNA repair protein RecO [unclassified Algoriphagus]UZD21867.1 DNA repair protein RecO [Algoriphagus sp. TR-M5]WBL43117.1 DNA repair protein RecO [Algoriphagus sp. TR-M9]